MKYFSCIEAPLDLSKYTITVTDDLCKMMGPLCGTYNILPARLLGLSYEEYIQYLFQKYQNKVIFPSYLGKPMFEKQKDAESFAGFLDIRLRKILENKE